MNFMELRENCFFFGPNVNICQCKQNKIQRNKTEGWKLEMKQDMNEINKRII